MADPFAEPFAVLAEAFGEVLVVVDTPDVRSMIQGSVKPCAGNQHDWPGDLGLEDDPVCGKCYLEYGQWTQPTGRQGQRKV
ncbi:hypothetical protein AB0H83_31145 [Dactylosporangium sp. NPDC050688]|uniref:hypothetical protein n=1 Tax=Dactylosporangium sp. NPDC050688 TaxID=3157217 RepID=UPI0033C435B3